MKKRSIAALAYELTLTELRVKQFQRLFGPLWWMIEPFMMSLVFYVLTRQLSGGDSQSLTFILISLTLWKFFQRSVETSLSLFSTYSYIIKQVNLPLMAPVGALVMTEFVYYLFGFGFLLLFGLSTGEIVISMAILYSIAVIGVLILFTTANVIFFATVSVFVRDLPSPMGILLSVAFFLSPGIYEIDPNAAPFRYLAYINPFYCFFPAIRNCLTSGHIIYVKELAFIGVISVILIVASYSFYARVRPTFLRVF